MNKSMSDLIKILPTEEEIFQRCLDVFQQMMETDYEPLYDILYNIPQPNIKNLTIVPRISAIRYTNSTDQPLSLSYYYKGEFCFNIPLYFRLPTYGYPIIAHVVTTTNDVIQNTDELEAFLEYHYQYLDPNKKLVGIGNTKYNIKQYIKLKDILIQVTENQQWNKDWVAFLPKPLYRIDRFHLHGREAEQVIAGKTISIKINKEMQQIINDQIEQNTIHQ